MVNKLDDNEKWALNVILGSRIDTHQPDMENVGPKKILDAKRILTTLYHNNEPDCITIIAGGRDLGLDYNAKKSKKQLNEEIKAIFDHINSCPWLSRTKEIITGNCKGVDHTGKLWAIANGYEPRDFDADWNKFGKQAGPIRNEAMAKVSYGLILFWDGVSPGSRNMLEVAQKHGLKLHTKVYNE